MALGPCYLSIAAITTDFHYVKAEGTSEYTYIFSVGNSCWQYFGDMQMGLGL